MNSEVTKHPGFGIACTVAWTELHQAIMADGLDVTLGKCGPKVRAWIVGLVEREFTRPPETTTPPASGDATPVPGDSVASAVGDLLAVMHGDGGHYHAEHGTEKAAADALVKYNAIQQSIAERTPPGDSVRVPGLVAIAEMVALNDGIGTEFMDFYGPRPPVGTKIYMLAAAPRQAEPPVAESATTPSDTVSSGIDPLPTAPYPAPQQAGPTCEESLQVQPPASPAGGGGA